MRNAVNDVLQLFTRFFTWIEADIVTLSVWIAFLWLCTRAAAAIVGEYAKRIWFSKIHKDELQRLRLRIKALEADFEAVRAENIRLKVNIDAAIVDKASSPVRTTPSMSLQRPQVLHTAR